MKLAARVGEVVMMRLKRRFNRPRPTQYYPTAVPAVARARPLVLSGRPRGHCAADRERLDRSDGCRAGAAARPTENSLLKLATEIGRNRVIAGFHFLSDIAAGVTAANMTYQFLSGMPICRCPSAPSSALSTEFRFRIGNQCCARPKVDKRRKRFAKPLS